MVALRLTDAGPPEVVWRSTRMGSVTPTPLAAGGKVYVIKDSGICVCAELRTGKELWTQRLPGAYSGSPVLADDKLFVVNEEGKTTVVQLGSSPERVSSNSLHDPMLATPAIAHGCLFFRSDRWLYCVGQSRQAK
jgi:outer membrane protein assembly factor BamB